MIAQLNDIARIWWQWMGSMFWQVSLFIVLVTALDIVIRKWAWPQVRYALWALVFIKLIISPAWQMPTSVVSWIQPKVEDQIPFKVEMSEKIEKGSANLNIADEVKAPVIIEQASWQSFALLTWLSGIVIFTLMLLRKMYKFRKMHRVDDNTGSPEWFNELILKTAARLKLRKAPSVLFSEDAKSPAVYGVFRPVLLLPDGYLDKLSNEQAEHVLMHELCHLKRGDLLVHWFCIVVQLVYWFNPLLIWTRRQMRYICEICCDLSVANILKEKTMSYRETLLHSARELFAENLEPSLGFLGIFEEPFKLVPRLRWLEKRSWENRRRRLAVTICTTLFMIICVMPMAGISQTSDYLSSESNDYQSEDESDTSRQAIYLEAIIIEVDGDRVFELGIDRTSAQTMGVEWTGAPPPESEIIQDDSPLPPVSFGILGEDIIINGELFTDFGEIVRSFQNESDVKIISAPEILTLNGEIATLSNSGNEILEPSMSIEITPTIEQDNIIRTQMELVLTKQLDDTPTPTTLQRKMETTVKVKDGNIFVMGYIENNDATIEENYLGKKNLYIFFKPRIEKLDEENEYYFEQ